MSALAWVCLKLYSIAEVMVVANGQYKEAIDSNLNKRPRINTGPVGFKTSSLFS
jgi:hypothetical protein